MHVGRGPDDQRRGHQPGHDGVGGRGARRPGSVEHASARSSSSARPGTRGSALDPDRSRSKGSRRAGSPRRSARPFPDVGIFRLHFRHPPWAASSPTDAKLGLDKVILQTPANTSLVSRTREKAEHSSIRSGSSKSATFATNSLRSQRATHPNLELCEAPQRYSRRISPYPEAATGPDQEPARAAG